MDKGPGFFSQSRPPVCLESRSAEMNHNSALGMSPGEKRRLLIGSEKATRPLLMKIVGQQLGSEGVWQEGGPKS